MATPGAPDIRFITEQTKFYEKFKDQGTARVVAFVSSVSGVSTDGSPLPYLYADPDCTVKLNKDQILDAFLANNLIIVAEGTPCLANPLAITPIGEDLNPTMLHEAHSVGVVVRFPDGGETFAYSAEYAEK